MLISEFDQSIATLNLHHHPIGDHYQGTLQLINKEYIEVSYFAPEKNLLALDNEILFFWVHIEYRYIQHPYRMFCQYRTMSYFIQEFSSMMYLCSIKAGEKLIQH